MKKKSILIILAVIMAVCCGIAVFQWTSSNEKAPEKSTLAESVIATEITEKNSTEKIKNSSTKKDNNKSSKSAESTIEVKSPKESKSTSAKKQTTESTKSVTTKQTTKKTAEDKTTPTKQKSTESKSISIKLSITCKNIDHADILSSTSITATNGDSVFDVTKKICDSNGIRLTYQSVYYIQGIGGVMEKDYGKTSGWMYRVNGTAPNTSAYNYKLKNSDTIEWYYVTSPSDK